MTLSNSELALLNNLIDVRLNEREFKEKNEETPYIVKERFMLHKIKNKFIELHEDQKQWRYNG